MRCSSCTTELWGQPAVCPVCGTPTGLPRQSPQQPAPAWEATPAAPAAPPAPSPSQPFFNAADLLDPDVLGAVPHAPQTPEAADAFLVEPPPAFLVEPPPEKPPEAEPPQGMINAADLFDPAILAELTGSVEGGQSSQSQAETPAPDDQPSPIQPPAASRRDAKISHPPMPPRSPKGPIAPPLFTLTALPEAQPAQPPPSPPFRSQPLAPGPVPPEEQASHNLSRGYRRASRPPRSGPIAQPATPPPPVPPVGPYPLAAPPPARVAAPPAQRSRPFLGTLGGFVSLALALAIIGSALLFGITRYFQLQALQPKPAPTTAAPLPTVAPKPGYTIYKDSALGFSLQHANSWKRQADHDDSDPQYQGNLFTAGPFTATGPTVGLEVGSSPLYANWSPSQIDDYILTHPFPLEDLADIQVSVPASSTVHIANLDWTAEDANITLTTGVSLRMTCLAIKHNGRGYAIFYFANQQVFRYNDTQYFEPMLLSFRFLDG